MNWIDILGYAASAMVLATFCMTTMLPLRLLAITSNVLFIFFGALAHIHPVLLLHLVLLPINVARLVQSRTRFNVPSPAWSDESGSSLGLPRRLSAQHRLPALDGT